MKRIVLLSFACALGSAAWLGVHGAAHGEGATKPATNSASLVYAQAASGLRMSHDTPAHRALSCERCHEGGAGAAAHADARMLPTEASCTPCHAEKIDRQKPHDAQHCGFCHRGEASAKSFVLAQARAPASRLVFSHAKHQRANVPCVRCHESARHAASPALPSMDQCLDCHRGERKLPCNGCHVRKPDGLLRTRFPEGKLIPRSNFLGMAHDADFIVRHRWLAADESAACSSCHSENECTACHDGARRPRSVHPGDYLTLHAQDAEQASQRCNSCHTTQTFCLSCHARLGVSPIAAPDLAAPKRLHPPTNVWLRGPMLHAREAERSMSTCVSCHAERDCIVCHGAKGIGAGSSPHPAGFREQCAAKLANNARACIACHGNVESLRTRCR